MNMSFLSLSFAHSTLLALFFCFCTCDKVRGGRVYWIAHGVHARQICRGARVSVRWTRLPGSVSTAAPPTPASGNVMFTWVGAVVGLVCACGSWQADFEAFVLLFVTQDSYM